MKVSVFTPSHDPQWLDNCYRSLAGQTYQDWEWIILLNGGAYWNGAEDDPRVLRRANHPSSEGNIGALKAEAISKSSGELLVELDHDDMLLPFALQMLVESATNFPDYSLFYSDTIQMNEDESPNLTVFRSDHGWTYYVQPDGYLVAEAMEPFPHNVAYIWYAPNHVRAFPRWAYDKAGGYRSLDILDDQDLMARLYKVGPFYHIHAPLYLQRVHVGNTQADPTKNLRIQQETVRLYDENVQALALVWADREGLVALDMGGAHNSPGGYKTVDTHDADLIGDAIDVLTGFPDDSVGVIRCVDFLEHLPPLAVGMFMEQAYRVLAHGGMLLTLTPSTDGRGAFQDPTHVSFWNENSWWYYTDPEYAKYVPEILWKCKFQLSRLVTYFPSEWHTEHNIPYVCANLLAIKDGPTMGGICGWR